MTASFVTCGSVDLVPALAIMLGANVGTTPIVQALSFNFTAVATLLFVVGVVAFKQGGQKRMRDLGRVAIGIGLMLLSLHILLDSCRKRHRHVGTLAGHAGQSRDFCAYMADRPHILRESPL